MFPSSPNIKLKLLFITNDVDEIGNPKLRLIKQKEVVGINKSITSKEHYESKSLEYKIDLALKIQSFIYDGSKYAYYNEVIYKIERTYLSGQFIELYFAETKIRVSDIDGFSG